jgi:hypothetical protein
MIKLELGTLLRRIDSISYDNGYIGVVYENSDPCYLVNIIQDDKGNTIDGGVAAWYHDLATEVINYSITKGDWEV